MKAAIAARVAAEIGREPDVQVKREKGGLGELRVSVDGVDVVDTNRLWYPTPSSVVAKVRAHFNEHSIT